MEAKSLILHVFSHGVILLMGGLSNMMVVQIHIMIPEEIGVPQNWTELMHYMCPNLEIGDIAMINAKKTKVNFN